VRMIAPIVDLAADESTSLEQEIQHGAVVGTIVDMTDQRIVLRNRERFVSLVAHELRNPLTVISGSVATITNHEQDELPPLTARLLPAVHLSAQKLDRIISDLLVSSQVDAGTLRLVEQEADVREVIAATLETATTAAHESGIALVDDLPNEPLSATCDVDRVTQVLDNLLSNAIKYTPAGGEIHVRAEQSSEHDVRISVADTGIGIAADDHRAIFERYGRTDLGSTVATGTGLGLAICLAIAEAHGGTIQVESELGVGSTFVFVLPSTPPASIRA
ncbi:MAG: HAMP domain-containing sensor histidine kinase, partial [Gaiellales bacterium]